MRVEAANRESCGRVERRFAYRAGRWLGMLFPLIGWLVRPVRSMTEATNSWVEGQCGLTLASMSSTFILKVSFEKKTFD